MTSHTLVVEISKLNHSHINLRIELLHPKQLIMLTKIGNSCQGPFETGWRLIAGATSALY
jgi:hypothetical protein